VVACGGLWWPVVRNSGLGQPAVILVWFMGERGEREETRKKKNKTEISRKDKRGRV
jgi:hypothetical protein